MQIKPHLRLAAAAVAALCCTAYAQEAGESHKSLTPTPQMQAVLDALQQQPGKPINELEPKDARKQPNASTAAASVMVQKGIDAAKLNSLHSEDDIEVPGPAGDIPVRVYHPGGENLPVIVYYHGGGFVLGDLNTYEQSCRGLAKMTNAIVFSVGYRLAPEHKFPAAPDDAVAAYKWVTQNAAKYKGDQSKVAVAGESAGGNLATGVAQAAKAQGFQKPTAQLLIYPWVNDDLTTKSYTLNEMAKPLGKAGIKWFMQQYLVDAGNAEDPRAFPAKAKDLSGLPPAIVITASIDPLHSEGEAYAAALMKAGVPTTYMNYAGVTHEFFGMGAIVDEAMKAEQFAVSGLKAAFSGSALPEGGKPDGELKK